MKISMKWLLVAAFAVAAMGVSAQSPVKLGHIESSKLMQAMPEVAEAQKTLQERQEEVKKESTNLREQFAKLVDEYGANNSTYSDIVRSSKEQEIQQLQERIGKFEELAVQELERVQQGLMQPIMDKATQAIKDVAKENGFTYIFDMNSGAVLYAAETSTDILPLVLKKLGLQ